MQTVSVFSVVNLNRLTVDLSVIWEAVHVTLRFSVSQTVGYSLKIRIIPCVEMPWLHQGSSRPYIDWVRYAYSKLSLKPHQTILGVYVNKFRKTSVVWRHMLQSIGPIGIINKISYNNENLFLHSLCYLSELLSLVTCKQRGDHLLQWCDLTSSGDGSTLAGDCSTIRTKSYTIEMMWYKIAFHPKLTTDTCTQYER